MLIAKPNHRKALRHLCIAAFALVTTPALAEQVNCHVTYGGETQTLSAKATADPYAIAPVAIGSYFQFRIVFQRPPSPLPAIKLYTLADRDGSSVPIHIAEFAYPPKAAHFGQGFSGRQTVYEPMRDGELQYWCELQRGRR